MNDTTTVPVTESTESVTTVVPDSNATTTINDSSSTAPTTTKIPSTEPNTVSPTTRVIKEPTTASNVYCPNLELPFGWPSTSDRDPGTIVRLRCGTGARLNGADVLLCQNNGSWNGTVPTCDATLHDLPFSTKLFIGVLTGCCGLVMLVVFVILCKLWFCTKPKHPSRFSDRHHRLARHSEDSLPPAPNPVQYQTTERRYNIYQGDIGVGIGAGGPVVASRPGDRNSVTYAKPEIYSTFINPGFYEDVYERWRRRESEDNFATEALYDSPWQHCKRPQGPGMDWGPNGLRAVENYDYGRFGKIPRSSVSDNSELDEVTSF